MMTRGWPENNEKSIPQTDVETIISLTPIHFLVFSPENSRFGKNNASSTNFSNNQQGWESIPNEKSLKLLSKFEEVYWNGSISTLR